VGAKKKHPAATLARLQPHIKTSTSVVGCSSRNGKSIPIVDWFP
jgi:hypothetical protein